MDKKTVFAPDNDFMRSLELATDAYQNQLNSPEGLEALQYLESRGITKEVQDYFRLGYLADPMPEHLEYKGRIVIPYITNTGVVSMRFKAVPNASGEIIGPKMLSLHGPIGSDRPYNAMAVRSDRSTIIIAEGEPDTWTGHLTGWPTIGFPGAGSWRPRYWPMFQYREVIIAAHNDPNNAGLEFAKKIVESIPTAKIVLMPPGHDMNSYYMENGMDDLCRVLGI